MATRKSKAPAAFGASKKALRNLAKFGPHDLIARRAEFGMTEGALKMLKLSAAILGAGGQLPEPYREYFARRFAEIAESGDPWKKPIFTRRRGQKAADQYDAQEKVAREVWRLHDLRGTTLEAAYAGAATKFSVSESTARNHYEKFGWLFGK
jgi:hypothetical protein